MRRCGRTDGSEPGCLIRGGRFFGCTRIVLGDSRLAHLAAADDRVGNLRCEQPDRTQRIVVARDDVVDFVRVAVGVDDADHRNLQLARLVDGDLFLARVHDEDRVRQLGHRPDAFEILQQLPLFLFRSSDLLLGERFEASVGARRDHRFQVTEPSQAALDRGEVGEKTAQPALIDEEHTAALRFLGDDVLRLSLRADEEHGLAVGRQVRDELLRVAELLDRLVQVEDVDSVSLAEDEFLHLRIPPLRLVAEVHAGLQ